MLGDQLLVSPIISPIDEHTKHARKVVWFPEGTWYNLLTGERHECDRIEVVYGGLNYVPVFARAGAIIPMNTDGSSNGADLPRNLELNIFAGADGSYDLYEDDGVSQAYQNEEFCITSVRMKESGQSIDISIGKPAGMTALIPETRSYTLLLWGVP